MNCILRWSFLVAAIFCFSRNASAATPKEVDQAIIYVRTMPREVKRLLSHGARSCFYGRFRLANTRTSYALHLFNPSPRQDNLDGNFQIYRLRLQLFERKPNRKMRLINNVAVNYRAMVSSPKKFAAHLLWLDPKRQTMPILKFDCFEPKGFVGLIGDHVLVIFSQGLKRAARVQSLAFGNWSASDYGAQNTTFNEIDNKGLLQLRVKSLPANTSPAPEFVMRWNGQKFVITQSKSTKNAVQNINGPPFPSMF